MKQRKARTLLQLGGGGMARQVDTSFFLAGCPETRWVTSSSTGVPHGCSAGVRALAASNRFLQYAKDTGFIKLD